MCTVSTVHRRDEPINLNGTCNQKTSNRHQTRRGRGQERGQRGRSAESHSLLRVSLPHAETGQVHHHTRAPHEIHKPTGGTEIPEEGKIPSPKSGAPNPSVPYALPLARPESLESPLKFPNLLRGSPPPPSVRTTRLPSQPLPRISTRGFRPCYSRHKLPRPARHRGPSRAREARGSFCGNPPLVGRRRPQSFSPPPRSAVTRVAWG